LQLRFTHLSGTNQNHVDTVVTTPILLGRDDVCQVHFDTFKELAVSGQHAQIDEVEEGRFQISNLSKNGVLVNGKAVEAPIPLPNHATIQLGKDGPRVRFDVDNNVDGISKTDVQKKTSKFTRKDLQRAPSPDTEERPIFKLPDAQPATKGSKNNTVLIGVIAGGIVLIGVLVFFLLR
jgi:pSer/pThr/pTyr-binding forkhead associated (FHA) protein